MTTPDPAEVVRLLSNLPFEALDPAIANLTRSGNRLGRAFAYGRKFQADHDPATLRQALDDFDAATGPAEVRGRVALSLVERQIEAVLVGQPADLDRIRRMVDEAGDDPQQPGQRAALHAMAFAASAMSDTPSCDLDTATTVLEQVEAPAGSVPAGLLAGLRHTVALRRAADREDASLLPEHGLDLPDLPGGRIDPMYETLRGAVELVNEASAAMRRGDFGAVMDMHGRMLEMLRLLPADHPSVRAVLGQLGKTMVPPDASSPRPPAPGLGAP